MEQSKPPGNTPEETKQRKDFSGQENTGQLMNALNIAVLAMQSALTPDAVFKAMAAELKKLNFESAVLLLDENKEKFSIGYLRYDSKIIKLAEKYLHG